MMLPVNQFKRGLREGRQQIGLWNSIPGPVVAEMIAGTGFDWITIDTEHSLTDIPDTLGMLQAMAPYPVSPIVRPQSQDPVLIKRLLDFGALTLMIPYVQSADEARALVAAMRYAPRGFRGAAGGTRASRFGQVQDYTVRAEEELCLIVQIETREAVAAIEEIAAVDGVDALFIGPGDLAASLGHPGELAHPEVTATIESAIKRIVATGKPAGILALDQGFARQCIGWGTKVTGVGVDLLLLSAAARGLAADFRQG
jgi:4-hydroxy-2-oxoheptanedioate aldolase